MAKVVFETLTNSAAQFTVVRGRNAYDEYVVRTYDASRAGCPVVAEYHTPDLSDACGTAILTDAMFPPRPNNGRCTG